MLSLTPTITKFIKRSCIFYPSLGSISELIYLQGDKMLHDIDNSLSARVLFLCNNVYILLV